MQNDNSTGDLTDSSKPTTSLPLQIVPEELMDIAEEPVELEPTSSVESLSVDDSVNVVSESFNTSYPENFVTISSNDIKSEKIKSTGFFAKISNVFTTIKDTFTSLFNHNTTKDYHSAENTASKFYVTKDHLEDTEPLGHVNDIDND